MFDNNNTLDATLLTGNPHSSVAASQFQANALAFFNAHKKDAAKLAVSSVYVLPFILSTMKLADEYPVAGPVFGSIACACIFRIGWVLYAEHFIGLFDPKHHEFKHIKHHLDIHRDEEVNYWSAPKKLLVTVAAVLCTFILGITKMGYSSSKSTLAIVGEALWLLAYSGIDAAPHVNHLQLQDQAIVKYRSLSLGAQCWVPVLMLGHALSDSADLWNVSQLGSKYLLIWVGLALVAEVGLSNVEAVAHHQLHFPELTKASVLKFSLLLLGAVSIAVFNWYNTFKSFKNVESTKLERLAFILLQAINVIFVTFEAWHHDDESHDHQCGSSCNDIEQQQSDDTIEAVVAGQAQRGEDDGELQNVIADNLPQTFVGSQSNNTANNIPGNFGSRAGQSSCGSRSCNC